MVGLTVFFLLCLNFGFKLLIVLLKLSSHLLNVKVLGVFLKIFLDYGNSLVDLVALKLPDKLEGVMD